MPSPICRHRRRRHTGARDAGEKILVRETAIDVPVATVRAV
jgi:hypothetical protein